MGHGKCSRGSPGTIETLRKVQMGASGRDSGPEHGGGIIVSCRIMSFPSGSGGGEGGGGLGG